MMTWAGTRPAGQHPTVDGRVFPPTAVYGAVRTISEAFWEVYMKAMREHFTPVPNNTGLTWCFAATASRIRAQLPDERPVWRFEHL